MLQMLRLLLPKLYSVNRNCLEDNIEIIARCIEICWRIRRLLQSKLKSIGHNMNWLHEKLRKEKHVYFISEDESLTGIIWIHLHNASKHTGIWYHMIRFCNTWIDMISNIQCHHYIHKMHNMNIKLTSYHKQANPQINANVWCVIIIGVQCSSNGIDAIKSHPWNITITALI